jgi:hypothetical protein
MKENLFNNPNLNILDIEQIIVIFKKSLTINRYIIFLVNGILIFY